VHLDSFVAKRRLLDTGSPEQSFLAYVPVLLVAAALGQFPIQLT
jgi:hypothetical protein